MGATAVLGGELPAGTPAHLTVEVAEDREFQHVVASAQASLSPASDWTCRVLVGGLRPARMLHRARLWSRGQRPELEQRIVEGDPELAL
jgi:phosphodiesterase/alkaline phosphatase D-like protein